MSFLKQFSAASWCLIALCAYAWLRLIDHLRVEWSLNEQYAYGWAVPLLCLYLAWKAAEETTDFGREEKTTDDRLRTTDQKPKSVVCGPSSLVSVRYLVCGLSSVVSITTILVILFVLTRWFEEANPDWRMVSWALALETVGLTLCAIYWVRGRGAVRQFAFPVLFFLVAVPWLTVIEHPIIQGFTRVNVSFTTELLNLLGFAAMQHGNTIETAGGWVDVDQGCSGIRSLQASLMIALFLGEFKRIGASARVGLVLGGVGLAFVFNAARTFLLSAIAAKQGNAAVERWHDPAGLAILVACFSGLWLLANWISTRSRRRQSALTGSSRDIKPAETQIGRDSTESHVPARILPGSRLAIALCAVVICGEIGVWAWYRAGRPGATTEWTAVLPSQNATFNSTELPAATTRMLRYDEGVCGTWRNGDGNAWQAFFFRWKPGKTAVHLARSHTPEACLPASGRKLVSISDLIEVEAAGLSLPFRCYEAAAARGSLYVFYCIWEDGLKQQSVQAERLTWKTRVQAMLERRRNPGQRVLEIAVTGPSTRAEAVEALRREVAGMIRR